MGSTYSRAPIFISRRKLLIEHFMPPFCQMHPRLIPKMADVCQASWDTVVAGTCVGYISATKKKPGLYPLQYFYDMFYKSLFENHPEMRPYFKGNMKKQGEMLMKAISGICEMARRKPRVLRRALGKLTKMHNDMKVQPVLYGSFAMNLLYALRTALGKEGYTEEVEEAWVSVISYMLKIIIPTAVEGMLNEIKDDQHINLLAGEDQSFGNSDRSFSSRYRMNSSMGGHLSSMMIGFRSRRSAKYSRYVGGGGNNGIDDSQHSQNSMSRSGNSRRNLSMASSSGRYSPYAPPGAADSSNHGGNRFASVTTSAAFQRTVAPPGESGIYTSGQFREIGNAKKLQICEKMVDAPLAEAAAGNRGRPIPPSKDVLAKKGAGGTGSMDSRRSSSSNKIHPDAASAAASFAASFAATAAATHATAEAKAKAEGDKSGDKQVPAGGGGHSGLSTKGLLNSNSKGIGIGNSSGEKAEADAVGVAEEKDDHLGESRGKAHRLAPIAGQLKTDVTGAAATASGAGVVEKKGHRERRHTGDSGGSEEEVPCIPMDESSKRGKRHSGGAGVGRSSRGRVDKKAQKRGGRSQHRSSKSKDVVVGRLRGGRSQHRPQSRQDVDEEEEADENAIGALYRVGHQSIGHAHSRAASRQPSLESMGSRQDLSHSRADEAGQLGNAMAV